MPMLVGSGCYIPKLTEWGWEGGEGGVFGGDSKSVDV
jgi:hypothetical protein